MKNGMRARALIGAAWKDECGSTAVITGVALFVIVFAVGVAIDFGRWHSARSATVAAVDAAVLAGARHLQLNPEDATGALAAATSYYKANVSSRLPLAADTIEFVLTDGNHSLTAKGRAALQSTFLNVMGIPEIELVSASGAGFGKADIQVGGSGGSNIEVAVMLDVTGSMCDDGIGPCSSSVKLDGLKKAAKLLVNTVVAEDQTKHSSRIALVPFSTRVRIDRDGQGGTLMKALTNLEPRHSYWNYYCSGDWVGSGGSEASGSWTCTAVDVAWVNYYRVNPCVSDRYRDDTGYDTTDEAPGPGRWLNAHGGDRSTLSWDSSDTPMTSWTGKTKADPSGTWNYSDGGWCADTLEGNEIMPLTSNRSHLFDRIDSLQGYGATAGALGTAWAWYVLSPRWSSIWTGNSTPMSYEDLKTKQANGAPKGRKVAVLMTDGAFNTLRVNKDQDQQAVSDVAVALCNNMKAQGIEIFTVGFALDQLTSAQRAIATATLRACGSGIDHFYDSLSVPQLESAFRDIAIRLSGLRLSH